MSLYKSSSLVMIPTAYKDGKLYSVRPTDGSGDFTFSRGSNLAATRVASSGYIEKGRENVLLQSNQFDTTWGTFDTSVTGGQSGYDGSNDAWKLECTSDGSSKRVEQSVSVSGVKSYSVYAKAGTADFLIIGGVVNARYFDLANGVVGALVGSNSPASIESVGNGWYRCTMVEVGATSTFQIYVANTNSSTSASAGDNIYIQDAQLEAGLVATDYIETGASTAQAGILEDMPRLDYSGSCPALLLEPQRTNSVTQSEYIGAWTQSALTITDNDAASPEGVSNAAKLTLPSGSAAKRIALGSMPVTAVARSYSFFVKSDDITAVQLVHSGDIQGYARFNISTGAVGSTGSKTTSTIEDYGNGWYRCIANFDSTNAFGSTIYLYINDSATGGYGGSTSAQGDLFVYGAQYEEGSYPTSYIPTYGSSVTRSQDIANLTDGVPNMIGANSFTFFYDCILTTPRNGSGTFAHLDLDGIIGIKGASNTTIRVHCIGSVNFATSVPILDLSSGRHKFAITMNSNGVGHYFVDGVKQTGEITYSGNGFVGDDSKIDGGAYNQKSNQLVVFPTALTDSECIALTTL